MTYDQPRYTNQPPHHHYPEAVFINGGAPASRETSVKQVTIPIVLAIAGAVVLVGATYAATNQFNDIKASIRDLSHKIDSLTGNLEQRINRLEEDTKDRTRDRWTRSDHDLWCARTERVNAKLGWRCADLSGGLPRPNPLRTWKSEIK